MKTKPHLKYWLAGAVALLTFSVYLPSLQYSFVEWDDPEYVTLNPYIRSLDLDFFRWAFSTFHAGNWHPLTWISHALDYAIWGLNPMGHHLTNNILHAINTFLVVLLVLRLIEAVHDSRLTIHDSRFALIAATTTGLLFGLHPVHVESVAWVAERKDLLCALFFLLSIVSYIPYTTNRTYKNYLLTLAFFALALLSKPMAVTLPFVLLILDWFPFRRVRSLRTFLSASAEKVPFFALSLVSSALTILAQKGGGAMALTEYVPLWARMLVGAKALVAYLTKMILPLNLVPFYQYPPYREVLSIGYLIAVAAVAGLTGICIFIAGKQKVLPAAWGYYVLTLMPVLGIIQVGSQSMADRYTYLPGIGPFFIAGLITAETYERITAAGKRQLIVKTSCIAAVLAMLVSMTFITVQQMAIWRDGLALWNYVIEKERLMIPQAYNNRGFIFLQRGSITEATDNFRTAVGLDPTYAEAHNNLCLAYKSQGLYNKAIEHCLTAISLKPAYAEAHNNLGVVYKEGGMYDKALEQYRTALSLRPDYADALFNLGIVYMDRGDLEKARRTFEEGLRLRPDDSKARQVLNRINSR